MAVSAASAGRTTGPAPTLTRVKAVRAVPEFGREMTLLWFMDE